MKLRPNQPQARLRFHIQSSGSSHTIRKLAVVLLAGDLHVAFRGTWVNYSEDAGSILRDDGHMCEVPKDWQWL